MTRTRVDSAGNIEPSKVTQQDDGLLPPNDAARPLLLGLNVFWQLEAKKKGNSGFAYECFKSVTLSLCSPFTFY